MLFGGEEGRHEQYRKSDSKSRRNGGDVLFHKGHVREPVGAAEEMLARTHVVSDLPVEESLAHPREAVRRDKTAVSKHPVRLCHLGAGQKLGLRVGATIIFRAAHAHMARRDEREQIVLVKRALALVPLVCLKSFAIPVPASGPNKVVDLLANFAVQRIIFKARDRRAFRTITPV